MSRRLEFFYDITLEFDVPVTEHCFVLRCLPAHFPGQQVLDAQLILHPDTSYTCQRDGFGNLLQIGRIDAPHTYFQYTASGTVCLDMQSRQAEPDNPLYRYPSVYTAPSPALRQLVQSLSLPPDTRRKAWALVEAVQHTMHYQPGVTGVSTTAADAFALGQGVCQDYAHIYLSLARLCGLSARYVNGLPQGEGASHAWCEVWLNGVWTGIDPTRAQWTDDGYIRFCVGRDFADCPIERGVFLGGANQQQTVFMKVCPQ